MGKENHRTVCACSEMETCLEWHFKVSHFMVFLKGLRESTSGFTTLSHLHIQNTIWYLLHHVTMADRDQRSSWISTCIVIPILFHLWEDRLNSKDWVLLLYCRFLHSVVSSHIQRPSKGQALNATGCNSPSYHLSNNDNSNNRKCSLTPASHFPFHNMSWRWWCCQPCCCSQAQWSLCCPAGKSCVRGEPPPLPTLKHGYSDRRLTQLLTCIWLV